MILAIVANFDTAITNQVQEMIKLNVSNRKYVGLFPERQHYGWIRISNDSQQPS
jgi:hypothetical protein